MAHPLHDLARKLQSWNAARLADRRIDALRRDPHLARDLGLMPKPEAPNPFPGIQPF